MTERTPRRGLAVGDPVGRRVHRRSLLAGGAVGAAALATGCDLLGDGSGGQPATAEPTVEAIDADSTLATHVAEALAQQVALAAATVEAFPALRRTTAPFASLHRAHAEELGGLPEADAVRRPRGGRAVARATFLEAEEGLQARLVRAAMAAESGALAQLFASMAAAVAQRRAAAG